MSPTSRNTRVAILVTDGFEQAELTGPRDALEKAGIRTAILSREAGRVTGWNHTSPADSFAVDQTFAAANAADYDALLLPGGVVNGDNIRMDEAAQALVRDAAAAGKPIAVICHGPWLLVSAGLVDGRTLTSWPSLADDLRNAGAHWVDRPVVVDGALISSRKPDDIPAFSQALIEALS